MTDKESKRLAFAQNSVELRPFNNIHYGTTIWLEFYKIDQERGVFIDWWDTKIYQ